MTERRAGQEIVAVRERLREDRAEVAVARGEFLEELEIEGQVAARVVAHGATATGVVGVDVLGGEAVHHGVVPLPVRPVPGMVEVGHLAVALLAERLDRIAAQRIGIGRAPRRTVLGPQAPEVVIVRAVLLHHDDDVLDGDRGPVQSARGQGVDRKCPGVECTALSPGVASSESQNHHRDEEHRSHSTSIDIRAPGGKAHSAGTYPMPGPNRPATGLALGPGRLGE